MAGKLEDLKSQLEITNSLNKALERQLSLQQQLTSGASKQSKLMQDMAGAAGNNPGIKKQLSDQRKLTKELENTKQKSKDLTNELQQGMKSSGGAIGGFKDVMGGLGKFMMSWKGMVLGLFGGLIGGITKVFSGLLAGIKGVFSLITNVVKVSMGVIKGLIMAPFKLMDKFSGIANEMHRISSEINGARQAVNGMIGDHKTLGTVTNQAYKVAKKAISTLPGGVFGPREEGAAARIKMAGELVKAFGPYQKQLGALSNAGAKFAVQMKKNLGFTDENFQKIAAVSKAYGKDLDSEFQAVTLGIQAAADAGGLNVKELGKDFNAFYAKLGPATGMATHKIVGMSAAFNRMGLSADTAMGMFSKFDTLEGGAEVVSKMSRSLGIHVSQTQMIMAREKGPLEQLRIVQKSMREAGKSFEDLSYDGKKMIAEMFGGDQAAAMKAFGRAGMESSDSIEKAAKAAAKAKDARDMPKIMAKLNKSVEKLRDSFGKIMKPFEAFSTGLTRGMNDPKFVANMKSISKIFENIGVTVGELLKNSGFLDAMSNSAKGFAKVLKSLMPLISELVSNLFSDAPKSARSPWEIIKEIGSKLLGGYGEFYSSISKFMIKAAGKIVPVLIKVLAWMGDAINNTLTSVMDGTFGSKASNIFDGLETAFNFDNEGVQAEWKKTAKTMKKSWDKEMGPKQRTFFEKDAMGNMKKVTKKAGVGSALVETLMVALEKGVRKLGSIFADILGAAFSKLWDKYGTEIAIAAALYMFGPALLKALMGPAVISAIGSAMGAGLAAVSSGAAGAGLVGAGAAGTAAAGGLVVGAAAVAGLVGYYGAKALGADQWGEDLGEWLHKSMNPAEQSLRHSAEENKKYWDARAKEAAKKKQKKIIDAMYADLNTTIKTGTRSQLDLLELKINLDKKMAHNEKEQLLDNIKKRRTKIKKDEAYTAATKKMHSLVGDDGLKALKTAGITDIKQYSKFDGKGNEKISIAGGMSPEKWEKYIGLMLEKKSAQTAGYSTVGVDKQLSKLFDNNLAAEQAMAKIYERTIENQRAQGYDMAKLTSKLGGYFTNVRHGSAKGVAMRDNDVSRNNLAVVGNIKSDMKRYLYQVQNNPAKIAEDKRQTKQLDMALTILTTKGKDADSIQSLAKMNLTDAKIKELKLEAYLPQIKAAMATQAAQVAAAQKAAADAASKSGGGTPAGQAAAKGDAAAGIVGASKAAGGKVKGVKVKPAPKVKQLGRLPADVLRLLASRKTAKRMFDAGLEMTDVMNKLGPAAKTVSEALNTAAIPALRGTASAAQQATSSLATTVVLLAYVRDKLAEVEATYNGILNTVVKVREESDKLKGNHSSKITTETGKLEVNIKVEVDSAEIAMALDKTPVVTWAGNMGNQG